jgi:hypothetical protein
MGRPNNVRKELRYTSDRVNAAVDALYAELQ